ncbi:MAG TPA: hypothetical protein VGM03_14805 [Phycisphaerae bacterium]|jgi:chromosome segregation ATPase
MSHIEHSVRAAQRRMFTNRWLYCVSWTLTTAAGSYAALALFARLYGWEWPLGWLALATGGAALVVATIWALVGRPDAVVAAAALDQAAGLRERISSGLYCSRTDDPFAQAVFQDADAISRSITVRKHLRLRVPSSMTYAAIAAAICGLMFLIRPGVLKTQATTQREEQNLAVQQTRAVVKQLDSVKRLTEKDPGLKELKEDLEKLEKPLDGRLEKPGEIRHEAIKKIDKLADAVRERRESAPYQDVQQLKNMLKRVKAPQNAETPAEKLSKALNNGDFKSAQEEIQALKEQLATLQKEQDPEQLKKLQEQLSDLSKQLEKAADAKQLAEKLEQAGVKKEDVERMLKNLTKQDLEQVKKQLEQQGMNQKQIEQLAKQLQQQSQAGSQAQKMSQAMQQAANAAGQGQMGQAMSQLQSAGEQLSQAEQLEQEKNQLDSSLADLQDAKNDLNNTCQQCNGTGQAKSGGT